MRCARAVAGVAVDRGGACVLADNADRPYKDERREVLLKLLCEEGDFEAESAARTTIELPSLQGDRFVIEERVVVRRG